GGIDMSSGAFLNSKALQEQAAQGRGHAAPLQELPHLPRRPVIDQPPEGVRRPRAVPVLPYLGSLRRQHEWLDVRHLAQRQSHALGGSAKADAVVDEQNPQWFSTLIQLALAS